MRRQTISNAIDDAVHRRWCGDSFTSCDRKCEGRLDMTSLAAATDGVMDALKPRKAAPPFTTRTRSKARR